MRAEADSPAPGRTRGRAALGAVLLLVAIPGGGSPIPPCPAPPSVTWTMINVNTTEQQADAHLLSFPDGRHVLIDAAHDGAAVVQSLRDRGVASLEAIVISHAHKDHYGGLVEIVQSGLQVRRVYFNLPDRSVCDRERPWGCDYEHVAAAMAAVRERGIPVLAMRRGDVLYREGCTRLKVLFAYDGVHTPVGRTDVNDTSAVLLLKCGRVRALFTGDLNLAIGEYVSRDPRLHADLLKVPHHGTEGVVPNAFFDRVAPKAVLVPAPMPLWLSERSRRIREYFETRHIPAFVSGLDGEVEVILSGEGFTVRTERGARSWTLP